MKNWILCCFLVVAACQGDKKYHDTAPTANPGEESGGIAEILRFQEELNKTFRNPETSPLPDRYRKDFEGLAFFAPDTQWRVVARLERTPNALPFLMPTNTERKSREVVFGIAHFELGGEPRTFELYQNQELNEQEGYEDYLFLPFTDATNGVETYGGGRYIDLAIPDGDSIVINFNKAYNPYCAYNKKYSCPLVPSVNALDIPVRAGVKAFDP